MQGCIARRGRTHDAARWAAAAIAAAALTAAVSISIAVAPAQAAGDLFVAPGGSDANPGSIDRPLATLQRAVALAAPGTTIQLRGGTYMPASSVQITKDGTATQPYTITAYQGERVILDGENLPYTPGAVGSTIPNQDRERRRRGRPDLIRGAGYRLRSRPGTRLNAMLRADPSRRIG